MSGNGAERLREGVLRFMGLASQQRRGDPQREPSAPRPPSPRELQDIALAQMLQSGDGGEVLLRVIGDRILEALDNAQSNVREHAVCVGFLGAHAALKRLYDDLVRLRG